MWWAAAAAATPYIMSALQPKQKRPQAPAPVPLTNRDGAINDLMDTANNPNTQAWVQASDQVADQVNRALGRQGLAGSSVGAQLQAGTQAKLAESWLADLASRKQVALNAALEYDKNQANHASGQNDAQYRYAMDAYDAKRQAQANQVAGVSNLIQAGMGAYYQDQAMNQRQQMIDMYAAKPTMGIPGSAPVASVGVPITGSPYDPGGAYASGGAYGMRMVP